MSQINISVIIPTCHRNDLLAKCLDCLAPGIQTLPADRYEVIVTDDGYKSTAEELVHEQYPWAQWVAGPRRGPAANRNNGAKIAGGEWLAFTDDDCLPAAEWLQAFEEVLSHDVLALEGAIHPIGDTNTDLAECPVNITGGNFWSGNIAVYHDLFKRVDGFDEKYTLAAHEDQDLRLRLYNFTNIRFVANARVSHPVRILALHEAIKRIPKRCLAWAFHVSKHRIALGIANDRALICQGSKYYTKHLLKQLWRRHFKCAAIDLLQLVFGIPLTIIYLHKQAKNY